MGLMEVGRAEADSVGREQVRRLREADHELLERLQKELERTEVEVTRWAGIYNTTDHKPTLNHAWLEWAKYQARASTLTHVINITKEVLDVS